MRENPGKTPKRARVERIPYGFVTLEEAAGILQVGPETVRAMLEAGLLQGVRVARSWRINPWGLLPLVTAALADEMASGPHLRLCTDPGDPGEDTPASP
jgi:excisionase family DNA binding protein